jgi:hypothetical protein
MVRDVHVNEIKGPVMEGRECHVIRVDWVKKIMQYLSVVSSGSGSQHFAISVPGQINESIT